MSKMISEFQSVNNLFDDGIVGPVTSNVMREKWGLDISQLAHFLGQSHVETGGFRYKIENFNYSKTRLLEIFPRYFTSVLAGRYAHIPEMIANIAYSNRLGNGDICSGDGWMYRGRGSMQLTGRSNYEKLEKDIPCASTDPDIVSGEYYWESGLNYFKNSGALELSQSVSKQSVRRVTRKINGGYTALNERLNMTMYYYKAQT